MAFDDYKAETALFGQRRRTPLGLEENGQLDQLIEVARNIDAIITEEIGRGEIITFWKKSSQEKPNWDDQYFIAFRDSASFYCVLTRIVVINCLVLIVLNFCGDPLSRGIECWNGLSWVWVLSPSAHFHLVLALFSSPLPLQCSYAMWLSFPSPFPLGKMLPEAWLDGCPWRVVTLSSSPASLTPQPQLYFQTSLILSSINFRLASCFFALEKEARTIRREKDEEWKREREVHVKLETHKK